MNSMVWRGALLIAGTTIGAGMLGLPLVTAAAGFFPGIAITFAVWIFMLLTGFLYLEATLWCPDGANILSIGETFLGPAGKWIAGLLYIFLYYALMVAYCAAGGALFHQFMGSFFGDDLPFRMALFVFGLIFSIIVVIGPRSIDRSNILMALGLVVAYVLMLSFGWEFVSSERLSHAQWGLMPFAAPVIFGAFGYHNIIPSLSTYLKRDRVSLMKAIVIGTLIPFVVYTLWQWFILGSLSQEAIEKILATGMPVTSALTELSGSGTITFFGDLFTFFAIVTSVLGVSFSMVDFFGDGLDVPRTGITRLFLTLLVFVPPFLLAYYIPGVFAMALGIAGGFGEAFLNGIFPVLVVYYGRYVQRDDPMIPFVSSRWLLALLFVISLFVAVIEAVSLH